MKTAATLRLLAVTLALAAAGRWLRAQGGPPSHAGTPLRATEEADDLAALERFLSLSDDELLRMQQAIARVRAMSPAERAALREQLMAFRRLPPEQRDAERLGWGWQSGQDRDDWRTMMHSLSQADHDAIRTQVLALPPEQRAARKHAILEAWRARTKTKP